MELQCRVYITPLTQATHPKNTLMTNFGNFDLFLIQFGGKVDRKYWETHERNTFFLFFPVNFRTKTILGLTPGTLAGTLCTWS